MVLPKFIEDSIEPSTPPRMILSGSMLISHTYDVLVVLQPDLSHLTRLSLRGGVHYTQRPNIPRCPGIAFLFDNLHTLCLKKLTCGNDSGIPMPTLRGLQIERVHFRRPANIFTFLQHFPNLTDLALVIVSTETDIREDDAFLPRNLNHLILRARTVGTLDRWMLQWMLDHSDRVPRFEHLCLTEVDDEGVDLVAKVIYQEGAHIATLRVDTVDGHKYAEDTVKDVISNFPSISIVDY